MLSKMKFSKNIGSRDRWIRFVIAVVLLALSIWTMSWILLLCAIFTFFESFMSWCILYQILGKSSCPIKRSKK
jgi:hypothetical protein